MASRQQTCSRERMNSVRQRCRNCDELARDNKDYLICSTSGKRNQKVGHRKIRPSYYGHPKPRSRSQEVERYMIGVCTRAPGTPHSKLCTTQHPAHTMRSCLCSPSSTAHFTPRQHLAAAVVPRHPNRTNHACAHQQAGRGFHPQQFWLSATPPSADSQPVKGTPEVSVVEWPLSLLALHNINLARYHQLCL